ncbi:hypothetical protein D3C85_1931610 [compost metagenome]
MSLVEITYVSVPCEEGKEALLAHPVVLSVNVVFVAISTSWVSVVNQSSFK